ncbi:hypothetical protein DSO57_1026635 [Entomophthora muscae]|uniref:Uncharacterized protein n=1 Tax=Entomophthora muscae TaxID=34485 RepID=A0ACC2TZV6_9FUNG|nr:hypothetical protein DSO57_1026635 [Entomophthora muscae]
MLESNIRKRENLKESRFDSPEKFLSECGEKLSEFACDNVIKDKVNQVLCTFHELPAWAQDNIYIHTGYRVPTDSYRRCLRSLLFLHNETGNVYSHLLGCLAFVSLAFSAFSYLVSTTTASWSDYAVVFTYIIAAIFCLGFSSLFHLFCCHSEQACLSWNKCDYVGITFLIVGSFFPAIFYGFYCENKWKLIYLSFISIFGLSTLVVLLSEAYYTTEYRLHRTAIFVGLALSGIIPITHAVLKAGIGKSFNSLSLDWFLFMGLFYILGALVYGLRIPERWFPGYFDFWFHSHQIFHVFVVAAAIIHYVGMVKAFHYHHSDLSMCLS